MFNYSVGVGYRVALINLWSKGILYYKLYTFIIILGTFISYQLVGSTENIIDRKGK